MAVNLNISISVYPCCCKIAIIHSFSPYMNILMGEDWFESLAHPVVRDANRDYKTLNRYLITFAHSNIENRGFATPASFAKWLRDRGEVVQEVILRHMILYTCSLSKKFFVDFNAYIEGVKK